jgi:peroxiredoxin
MGSVKMRLLWLMLLLIAGCGGTMNDLAPSNKDKRPAVMCGITGTEVCQIAPDFTLSDTQGNMVSLSSVVSSPGVRGTVIYFTMWCPTCDTHMSNMRFSILPSYPTVRFFIVDYVSGSVAMARNEEMNNGYSGSRFTVLADTNQTVLARFHANMGTTVVIDSAGVVRMNEDFKDGTRLQSILANLP